MSDAKAIYNSAVTQLRAAGVDQPERDVMALLRAASDEGIYLRGEPISDEMAQRFQAMLDQRLARKPVSQIIGYRAFWNHDFIVTGDVLDPRPDTETLVDLALMGDVVRVLDLGCGSGCILLSILAEAVGATGLGVDISPAALDVARRNAVKLGVADRVTFQHSDWFEHIEGQFDLVVSNPPYIALDEMAGLAPEVRQHEPRFALTDEGDGLSAYRRIAAGVGAHLAPGGRLLLEIGPTQANAVTEILRAAGLENIATHPDLDGRDRVISAQAAT